MHVQFNPTSHSFLKLVIIMCTVNPVAVMVAVVMLVVVGMAVLVSFAFFVLIVPLSHYFYYEMH